MAFKQNNKEIKKIITELKGASKLHAGQAKKLEGMIDDSPLQKRWVNLKILTHLMQMASSEILAHLI